MNPINLMNRIDLIYWMNIGEYVKKKDKIDMLDFLYKQCKMHH
jgi:hypothetical protein